jgi:hypothetical protein
MCFAASAPRDRVDLVGREPLPRVQVIESGATGVAT